MSYKRCALCRGDGAPYLDGNHGHAGESGDTSGECERKESSGMNGADADDSGEGLENPREEALN